MDENDTLFGKILRREIPSTEVYSDEYVYAFRDINPGAPTHVLIIPRKYIPMASDVTEEDAELVGRMVLAANKIAKQEGVDQSGYRLVINVGEGAGQSVFHLHMHLLGGRALSWPPG